MMSDPNYQAQAILARRDHSEQELRIKLRRKKFTPDQINSAISKLKKIGLIDDQSFAVKLIRDTINRKPVGPRWLTHKLKEKGIAEEIIEDAIADTISEEHQQQLIIEAIQRWRRTHPQHATDQQRLMRFLVSRGFTSSHITEQLSASDYGS